MSSKTKKTIVYGKGFIKLFWTMFTLSAFTFGGGYVIVSLLKQKIVDKLHWIDDDEMLNLVAIAQTSPGAVAVNASMLVGFKVGGIRGAIVSIFGTVLPPFIILSLISVFYAQFRSNRFVSAFLMGMQPAIAAIIADVVVNLGKNVIKQEKVTFVIIMIVSFIAVYFFHVNLLIVLCCCAVIGGGYSLIKTKINSTRFLHCSKSEDD